MLEAELSVHPIRLYNYIKENSNWKDDNNFLNDLERFVSYSAHDKEFDVRNCISDIMNYVVKYIMYPEEQETAWIVILKYRVEDLQRKFEDPYKRLAVDQKYIDELFNQYIDFEKDRYFERYPNLCIYDFDNITSPNFIKKIIIKYAYTNECKEYARELFDNE